MFYRYLSVLLLLPSYVFAQNINPPRGRVFNDSIIVSVYIKIDPDSLSLLYLPGNECSNHEFPVQFIWADGILPNDTFENVGIRFKGNTSRYAKKKSFKLSFNTFESGRNFHDIEKLNLNGEHNDPGILREKLYWDAMYKNNAPALRNNYVKLFVNGKYFGLYINMEDLDENFTRSRFGSSEGNLYKCYFGADLVYKGPNGNFYKNTGTFCGKSQRVYELQNNNATDNYQGLADFINALNNLPLDSLFPSKIKKYFNVEDYLKILSLEIASGHWDNYVANSNNYFLYENPRSGQIEYISYDADNTFGIDWINDDWGTKNVYQFNGGKTRPLYTRLLAVPEFKNKFDYYLNEITTNIYDTNIIYPRIDYIHSQIWTAAISDTFRSKDWGFTVGQFHNSYIQTIGVNFVKYGLKPFFSTRNQSIKAQISHNNISPVLTRESHSPLLAAINTSLQFSIKALDDESPLEVKLNYTFDPASGFNSLQLYDDGLHGDGNANDGYYGLNLPSHNSIDTMIFYYSARSVSNQFARYPSIDNLSLAIGVRSSIQLRINELMAKNTKSIRDGFEEYDDWLEIINIGNTGIDLGKVYLSNSIDNPFKFKLPGINLPTLGFSLFWCDNQTNQGSYHTNFRLSASYEWVGLFDNYGLLIDSISYKNLADDISFGRIIDGSGNFITLSNRTPGYSNNGFSFGINNADKNISISPNPATNEIHIRNQSLKEFSYFFYNSLGQIITEGRTDCEDLKIDIAGLPEGVYFISYVGLGSQKIIIKR